MGHRLKAVAALQEWNGWLGLEKPRRLLSISVLATAATACSSLPSLDVLAYDVCVGRHPQEVAICEGPRQAYELEPTAFQARAVGINPPADSRYEARSSVTQPAITPVPHPSAIASNRSE